MNISKKIVTAVRKSIHLDKEFIGLHEPDLSGNELKYLTDCVKTGWISSVGSYVDQIEMQLSEMHDGAYVTACVNGTCALNVAYWASGIGYGDEVLVPSLTFVATANSISHVGAIPHFIDSEYDRLTVCPDKLSAYLAEIAEERGEARDGKPIYYNKKSNRRLAALVPVHIFGIPARMDELSNIAVQYGLSLIEDSTESLGSRYKGRPTATLSDIGTISFNGNKILSTGGGGALVSKDKEVGARLKRLCTTSKIPHKWEYYHDEVAFNYRMPNVNAAIGCAQIERLDQFVENKKKLFNRYKDEFSAIDEIELLECPEDSSWNHWLLTLRIKEENPDFRDALLTDLNNAGFMSRPIWTLMHKLPMYQSNPRMGNEVSESLSNTIINIPSSAFL